MRLARNQSRTAPQQRIISIYQEIRYRICTNRYPPDMVLREEELAFFKETLSAHHRALAEGLLGLCDGQRSAEEIALMLSLDFDRIVPVEDVVRGIELFERVGYLS